MAILHNHFKTNEVKYTQLEKFTSVKVACEQKRTILNDKGMSSTRHFSREI